MNKYISTSFLLLGAIMMNAQETKNDSIKQKEIEKVELFGVANKKPKV